MKFYSISLHQHVSLVSNKSRVIFRAYLLFILLELDHCSEYCSTYSSRFYTGCKDESCEMGIDGSEKQQFLFNKMGYGKIFKL